MGKGSRDKPQESAVRYMGGSGSGRSAKITAFDLDDPSEPPADAWWAFVMAEDPQIGSGRYGWWRERPDVNSQGDGFIVQGEGDEPKVLVTAANMLSLYIAQMRHTGNPVAPIVETP
jgi:hypothetical protein